MSTDIDPEAFATLEAQLAAALALPGEFAILKREIVDLLATQIEGLKAQLHASEEWNAGLMKLTLTQEFRFWQRVAEVDPTSSAWPAQRRDRKAAEAAFDFFAQHVPESIRPIIQERRDTMIENMLEHAGHAVSLN